MTTAANVLRLAQIVLLIIGIVSVMSIIVRPTRAANIVTADSISTTINDSVSFNVLANDPSGTKLVDHTEPSYGRLSKRDGGHFSYLPNANFVGIDSFSYQAQSGAAAIEIAVVTIEVTGLVTSVESRDDDITVDEDAPTHMYVLDNDAPGPAGTPLTVAIESGPDHGSAEVQADGSVLYVPAPNWSGIDAYAYTASDGSTSDSAVVTINVTSVDEPPDAVDDAVFTRQESSASIDVFANDSEADGDGFALAEYTQPLYGTATWSDLDHMIIYDPGPGFWGPDQFTYTIGDVDGFDTATITVTVDGAPVALDDPVSAVQSTPIDIRVLDNDSDPEGEPLVITSVGVPEHGSAAINSNLTVQYSPDTSYVGQDSFTYTIQDDHGSTSNAIVTIDVTERAAQSTGAVDDEFLVLEDSPGNTLDILSNDVIPEADTVSIFIDSAPAHGAVTLDAMQLLTYVPNVDYVGQDSFTYSIGDGVNPRSTATVSIEIQAVNDPPLGVPDSATVDEDTEIQIDAIANDSDPDGDLLTVDSVSMPASGTANVTRHGMITYTPNADFAGEDTFTYVVADGSGNNATSTITVTVNPINDAPTAVDDTMHVEIDAGGVADVLTNDHDPDGPQVLLFITTQPIHGTAYLTSLNTIAYTPEAIFEGYDSLEYQFSDGYATSTATVSITVGNPNTRPNARDDEVTTVTGEPVTFAVLENDTDVDGDELVVYGVSKPEHGAVTVDEDQYTYTPEPDFVGADSFTYKVRDGHGGRDQATVKIDVNPVKDRRSNEK